MRGLWSIIWLLLPLFWLVWARRGLPGPAMLFPRGPIRGQPSPRPPLAVWMIGAGLILWATVLVWPAQTHIGSSTLFLVDNSSSMSEPALLANAKIGTRLGLGTEILGAHLCLIPENDRIGLVRFSSMPRVLAPLTRERAEVARLLDQITPEKTPLDAQTNLVDALIEGLTRVLAVPSRNQRIILWSDGEANVRANASGWSLNTVAEAIRAFGVELIIVDGGPSLEDLESDKQSRRAEAKALLADLAKATGGKLIDPLNQIPLPVSASTKGSWDFIGPVVRMVSGWVLVVLGIGLWLFEKKTGKGNGALQRSIFWSNEEIRSYRGMVFLSALGLSLGLASIALHFWNRNEDGQRRAVMVDVQQGMLAGQPTRLERSRTILERALQNYPVTCELGLWVMGAHPVCLMAPTEDWSAILDELQRLEAWAEDSLIWERRDDEALPLPGKGILFWDGRDLKPFENGLPWGWSVVDMSLGEDAKAERFGESRILAGDPKRVQTMGSWGRTIPGTEFGQKGMIAIKHFLGAEKSLLWAGSLWAMGLVSFLLVVGFPRPGAGWPKFSLSQRFRSVSVYLVLIPCFGAVCATTSQIVLAQNSLDQKEYSKQFELLREKLESLKGVGQEDLERAAKELIGQLEQYRDANDPQWVKMNFLARAALWRARRQSDSPPPGPGQGESPRSGNTESGIRPFPGNNPTREFPIPGDPTKAEGPESARKAPLVGFEEMESDGLWGQLRDAQKKVAREVTIRRLGRIIPRPWNPTTPEIVPSQGGGQ